MALTLESSPLVHAYREGHCQPVQEPSDTIDRITQLVFMQDEPRKVELALVLGSPSVSSMQPAVDLYASGLASLILISGHGPAGSEVGEWVAFRDFGLKSGIADAAMMIEPRSTNTLENIVFSAELIETCLGWRKVLDIAICCKPLHTRRAYMTARQHFPGHVRLSMCATNGADVIKPTDWWTHETGRTRVLGELRRISEYSLQGDISLV